MFALTEPAEVIMASLVMCVGTDDEEEDALKSLMKLFSTYPHEVDELVVRGFITRENNTVRLTEAGLAYAAMRVKDVEDAESFSHVEDGSPGFTMRLIFDFDELDCERTIVVPAHITFEEFHTIIQATMNWMNYHLYDFTLEDKEGKLLVLTHLEPTPFSADSMWQMFSMGDEEGERIEAADVYLDSIFPDVTRAVYNYDYGDSWCILIECLGATTLEDGFATCLDGVGDAPPEDVGGEWGFQEFLGILADPSDPERSDMVEWGTSQGYEPYDRIAVMSRLRRWRDFTAVNAKSYAFVSESHPANKQQGSSAEEAAAHDKAAAANRTACSKYLDIFEKSLRASRVSEKTVQKHLDGMKLYLIYFLNDGDVATMQEGPALVNRFMSYWAPSCGWASKTSLKGYATSLKKFYKCMLDEGLVSEVTYRYLLDEIKFRMDEWLEPYQGASRSYGYWVKTN